MADQKKSGRKTVPVSDRESRPETDDEMEQRLYLESLDAEKADAFKLASKRYAGQLAREKQRSDAGAGSPGFDPAPSDVRRWTFGERQDDIELVAEGQPRPKNPLAESDRWERDRPGSPPYGGSLKGTRFAREAERTFAERFGGPPNDGTLPSVKEERAYNFRDKDIELRPEKVEKKKVEKRSKAPLSAAEKERMWAALEKR